MQAIREYKQFVREQPEKTKTLEEMMRMGALMLPTSSLGENAEIATEMLYSALGFMGFYHDVVISKNHHGGGLGAGKEDEPQAVSTVRTILTVVSNVEVVLEMSARRLGRRGDRSRWRLIYYIELVKAILRFYLLTQTNFGTVLQSGGVYESKVLRAAPTDGNEQESGMLADGGQASMERKQPKVVQTWTGKRCGKSLTLPPSSVKYVNSLLNLKDLGNGGTGMNATGNEEGGGTAQLESEGPGATVEEAVGLMGELLHIFRPVLYVLLVRALRNKKSWTPWVASLAVDLLSARCSSLATSAPQAITNNNTKASPASAMGVLQLLIMGKIKENNDNNSKKKNKKKKGRNVPVDVSNELRRRRMLLLLYLMRSPVFESVTLKVVTTALSPLENVPLLKLVASTAAESLDYYHRNHFYSSGS